MLEIGMNPNIFQWGSLTLSWHGLLAVVAVAVAVYLTARWAPQYGISKDAVYETAVWVLIGAVIGARVVAILDELSFYRHNPQEIIAIWRGGQAIWGGVLGGLFAGVLYARAARLPVGRLADVVAPALLIGLILGRVGDIINGEHCAKVTSMPWGFIYTHPNAGFAGACYGVLPTPAMHPAIVYEMLWNAFALAVVWFGLKDRIRPEGTLMMAMLALYAFGRFFVLFYHTYTNYLGDLNEAQLLCLAVLIVTVPLLAFKAKLGPKTAPAFPALATSSRAPSRPRPERRREATRQARRSGR